MLLKRNIILHENMGEHLCLQWADFRENVDSAFGRLRYDKVFADVTLACEDGQQMDAHKVILAASSPIFEEILQRNKHPHPMIYMRGFQSKHFASILDFLYLGEANVFQVDLDSFLYIAEEIKLKGLTQKTSSEILEAQRKTQHPEPVAETLESTTRGRNMISDANFSGNTSIQALEISSQSGSYLQSLDEKVKTMMDKGQNMITFGKQKDGKPIRVTSCVCKVCGKEGRTNDIRNHIEANHLEGISLPCDYCDKTCPSRASLRMHITKFH